MKKNKQKLYEHIMQDVSKIIKKHLYESEYKLLTSDNGKHYKFSKILKDYTNTEYLCSIDSTMNKEHTYKPKEIIEDLKHNNIEKSKIEKYILQNFTNVFYEIVIFRNNSSDMQLHISYVNNEHKKISFYFINADLENCNIAISDLSKNVWTTVKQIHKAALHIFCN